MTELSPADAGRTQAPETPPNSPDLKPETPPNSPEYLMDSTPPPSRPPRRSRSPRQRWVVAGNVLEKMHTSMTQKYETLADMPVAIRQQFQRLLHGPTFDPSVGGAPKLTYQVTFKIETAGWDEAYKGESD